ncbi:IS3 family transposase, partial [bacterium]|nr:IS3 family transposase [bacterium]NDD86054.1 IS3 family transposase [bacterium]
SQMKRNSYSPELKAEVVLEVLSGLKTVQQIGQERGIHPVSITSWVKEARAKLVAIFKGEIQDPEVALQKEVDTLHKKIGQLAVENDFLKKVSGKWK